MVLGLSEAGVVLVKHLYATLVDLNCFSSCQHLSEVEVLVAVFVWI